MLGTFNDWPQEQATSPPANEKDTGTDWPQEQGSNARGMVSKAKEGYEQGGDSRL
jgi:hypothetical protein